MEILRIWKLLFWQMTVIGLLGSLSYKTLAQVPSSIPTNNLIGYWPLNGNFQNAHSTAHHGTNNGAVPAPGKDGVNSTGMRFNGLNQFATLPATVMSQVTGPFTVSVWLKADSVVPNNLAFDPINDRTSAFWNFRFRLMYGQTNFGTYSPDSAYMDHINNNSQMPRAAAPFPNPDAWVHYVMVYAGTSNSGVMRIYHNGQLSGVSGTTNLFSGGRPINLGRGVSPTMPNGYGFFGGVLDEIGVWNRALTDAEILTIYQSCVLSVTNQPSSQTVLVGGSTSFAVTPGSPTANIQWQTFNAGQWVSLVNGPNFSGVNSPVLSLSNVGFGLNGSQFRAFISDTSCNGSSQTATLTVNCAALVNQSPSSTAMPVGGTATFVAGSTATGAQYQWQVNTGSGFTNLTNFGQYSGVNGPTLTVSNLQRSNDGYVFRCVISFLGCTETTQSGQLSVFCNDLILQHPTDFNGTVGGAASFSVTPITGATYRWLVNTGFGFSVLANAGQFAGANTANLVVSNLSLQNHNSAFVCIVNSGECADTSALAILRVATGTGINDIHESTWKLYPNPATDAITLDLLSMDKPSMVRVFDLLGRTCFEAILEPAKHTIHVDNWSSGFYWVEVAHERQRLVVKGR